jgi:hypothetical protein
VSIIPPADVAATGVVAPPDHTPRPGRWLVFAIVGAALLMISIDQTTSPSPRTGV